MKLEGGVGIREGSERSLREELGVNMVKYSLCMREILKELIKYYNKKEHQARNQKNNIILHHLIVSSLHSGGHEQKEGTIKNLGNVENH